MPTTLKNIQDGLAERLETIRGLRVYPREPASMPNEIPCIVLRTQAGSYTTTYGGGSNPMDGIIRGQVIVGKHEADEAWQALDALLSPKGEQSINVAIQGDSSLGLEDVDAALIAFEEAGAQDFFGQVMLGAIILVRYLKVGP